MKLLLNKISRLEIGWNERPLGEVDAYRLCERFGVTLNERPLSTDGFYYRMFGRDYIAINSRLRGPAKLAVLFHELAHCLFHAPVSGSAAGFHHVGQRTRQEIEADMFAICALLPLPMVSDRTPDELVMDGFPADLVAARTELLARYGI